MAIAEGAAEAYAFHSVWANNTQEMANTPVENPAETLMSLLRPLGISPSLADFILDGFAQEPNNTLWGLVNAITRAANEVPSISLAEQLWSSAGVMVQQGAAICRSCGHVLLNGEHKH